MPAHHKGLRPYASVGRYPCKAMRNAVSRFQGWPWLTTRLQHEARITHADFNRTGWVPNRSGWAHDSDRTTSDRGSSSTNREMGKAGQRLLSRTSTA